MMWSSQARSPWLMARSKKLRTMALLFSVLMAGPPIPQTKLGGVSRERPARWAALAAGNKTQAGFWGRPALVCVKTIAQFAGPSQPKANGGASADGLAAVKPRRLEG